MSSSANSTPLYPFDNPGHALVLVGLGWGCWTIGTAIRSVASKPSQMREIFRHNPWTVLFKGRANTPREEQDILPDVFFKMYGVFGFGAVWIGYMLLASGLTGLVVSLTKKLF